MAHKWNSAKAGRRQPQPLVRLHGLRPREPTKLAPELDQGIGDHFARCEEGPLIERARARVSANFPGARGVRLPYLNALITSGTEVFSDACSGRVRAQERHPQVQCSSDETGPHDQVPKRP